ncbi:MAG TPA: hypothetical protein VFS13_04960 [Steroidobacteraceae bacterium]|jgi:hypothetical protein|nr:hypothetical protein [Steroidobacteraceae bacterium]
MNHRTGSLIGTVALLAALPSAFAQEAPPAQELVVIDLRPAEEKEGSALQPLSGKCNQDVFRIPDVASDPLKIDLLKQDLAPMVGTEGKTLTVLNWSIYYNKQVQKSGGGALRSVGVGGYAIPTGKGDKGRHAGSKCSRKESAGGWYQADELSGVYFPLISEFTGTFAGKPVNVRVVYSPSRKLPGKFEGDAADTEALLEAVHQTSEAVSSVLAR